MCTTGHNELSKNIYISIFYFVYSIHKNNNFLRVKIIRIVKSQIAVIQKNFKKSLSYRRLEYKCFLENIYGTSI